MPEHTPADQLKKFITDSGGPTPTPEPALSAEEQLRQFREEAGVAVAVPPVPEQPVPQVQRPQIPQDESRLERRNRELREQQAARDVPASGSLFAERGTPRFAAMTPRQPLETVARPVGQALDATAEALSQVAGSSVAGQLGLDPIANLLGLQPITFAEGTAFGELARGQDPRETGTLFLEELAQKNVAQRLGTQVLFDPLNVVPGLGVAGDLPVLGRAARGTQPLRLPSLQSDIATQLPSVGLRGTPNIQAIRSTVPSEPLFRPGPYEFPDEIARARQVEKTAHVEAVAPGGPSDPLPPPGTFPTGAEPLRSRGRLLTKAGAAQLQDERIDQSLLRLHEAAIDTATREARDLVDAGNRRLLDVDIGVRRGVSVAARERDILPLDRLTEALHNPNLVESGELTIAGHLRPIYDELRGLMDWESAARLDFDPDMAIRDNYFYRGWKPPEGMFTQSGPGRGELIRNPAFRKVRNNLTYREMRDLGFEPLFWNPYEQLRFARLEGVRYREQMELVDALKQTGDEMIRPHEGGPIPQGWRVPEIGPAFEGKPFPFINEATGQAQQGFTRRWIVQNKIANSLENIYGKQPSLPDVNVFGKDIDLIKWVDWATFIPKRAKLFGSFFQQVDFLTRGGVGAWHGMVNALRTGHPIQAVQHLALYPQTASDIIGAYFRPNFRASLRRELSSTEPLLQGRSGVTLKGITDAGLSIADVTILPSGIDDVVRDVARETGLVRAGKAVPRAIVALEGVMRRGLFEGVYPAAIINDVRKNITPVFARTYPDLTDEQLMSAIATQTNKRYSSIPASQTVVQPRWLREILRRVFFSINESEGLLRQGTGVVRGPFKAFWAENWLGAYLFLMTTAGIMHFASTGKLLPLDRFTPISSDKWGPLPFGYDRRFASPTLPFDAKGGLELTLDIVGQMDTVFRILDPWGFVSSRENVSVRALENQIKAEDFYGQSIDEVGPGGVVSRTVQLARDLFSPIGPGQAGIEILRQRVPGVGKIVLSSEERIGIRGHLIQATGVNVRGELINDALKRLYPEGPRIWSDQTYDTRRKQLIEAVFGPRTEADKERFSRETDEFFGVTRKKEDRDSFFGR